MISMIARILFLFAAVIIASCGKQQMAEQNTKPDSSYSPQPMGEMGAATAPKQTSPDIIEMPESKVPDSIRQKLMNSMSSKDIPIGSLPQLRAEVLAQFQPQLKDFTLVKNKNIEQKGVSQSIHFF